VKQFILYILVFDLIIITIFDIKIYTREPLKLFIFVTIYT